LYALGEEAVWRGDFTTKGKKRDDAKMNASCSRSTATACTSQAAILENPFSISYLETIIDRRLRVILPSQQVPPQLLHTAFGYSVLAPGKRLRPTITMLTCFQLGRRDLAALDCACAIEMVHAASLVLDDLPCMDNAERRRGQPTAHRKFGEDIAVLSSVGLLNMAFGVVAAMDDLPPEIRINLVGLLSHAVGSNGLIAGQLMDLKMRSAQSRSLERLNDLKTGALFVAAAEAGAIVAGSNHETLKHVRGFASELGLAFQIADDILDTGAYADQTGKDTGKDVGKPTLLTVLGEDGCRAAYGEHVEQCRQHLAALSATDAPLGKFVEHCLAQVEV
jgi:geranylgeranyl diphosphate synthase type II